MGSAGTLAQLSQLLGAPEAAICLLLSILLGFPIAIVHRYTLYGKNPTCQHIFFVICGLSIGYWNYGHNILHSCAALFGTYLLLVITGYTLASVVTTFAFNMGYLLYGYYTTSTEDYDIKWTMPHCVLTLRLIGLAFNILDGQRPDDELSAAQKQYCLKTRPSFLEVAAFMYFPGSFLIGPQFSMKRYLDYVNGQLIEQPAGSSKLPDCLIPGLIRIAIGFTYVGLYQLGTTYVSDQYLLEPSFEESNIFKRLLIIGVWGHILLYKYISCWLITEGVCTAFGITYNGKDKEGNVQWNGCENVKLLTFEKATRFHHYIISFNINTNNWCAEYIYKRLKWMGSRKISQAATLLFLAVWHGFHSGYYNCFMLEFLVMFTEKDILNIIEKSENIQNLLKNHYELRILSWIVAKLLSFVFMGYCLVSFCFLSYSRYMRVYSSLYFIGHIIFVFYPIFSVILRKVLLQKPRKKVE